MIYRLTRAFISPGRTKFLKSGFAAIEKLCKFNFSTVKNKTKLDDENMQMYIKNLMQEYQFLKTSENNQTENTFHRLYILEQLSQNIDEVKRIQNEIEELQHFINDKSNGNEMVLIAKDDLQNYNEQLVNLDNQIISLLAPKESGDDSDVYLEITAGVGGQEAMLFANDIYQMYFNFANYKKWEIESCTTEKTELGGIRQANLALRGYDVYGTLKHEGGVHRVQRVPKTEKSGRIHTSTVTVAVIPQPNEIEVQLNPKDLKIETKRSSGAGGQHVNTTDSAVRITYLPTGLVTECQTGRSQIQNKKEAMNKLRALLFEQKLEEQYNFHRTTRKLQIGTSARSEKIRTYNFIQDRVTDHRINFTLHNLPEILQGRNHFEQIISVVREFSKQELLQAVINNSLKQTK